MTASTIGCGTISPSMSGIQAATKALSYSAALYTGFVFMSLAACSSNLRLLIFNFAILLTCARACSFPVDAAVVETTKLTAKVSFTLRGGNLCKILPHCAFAKRIADPTIPSWWKRKSHPFSLSMPPRMTLASGRSTTFVETIRARANSIWCDMFASEKRRDHLPIQRSFAKLHLEIHGRLDLKAQ